MPGKRVQSEADESTRQQAKQAIATLLQDYLNKNPLINVSSLARQVGITRSNMSKMVHGHILPEPATCQSIAAATGISARQVLELAGHLPAGEVPENIPEIYDPELAIQFSQIGSLEPEDIAFFKDFLGKEIKARQFRQAQGQQALQRPPFARPIRSGTSSTYNEKEKGGSK